MARVGFRSFTLVLILLIVISITPYATASGTNASQAPDREWQWIANSTSEADAVAQTDDGGSVIAGDRTFVGVDNNRVYVSRLDEHGEPLWEKYYGENKSCYANDICLDRAGNYLVSGFINDQKSQACLLKISPDGNLLWLKTYFNNASHVNYCNAKAVATSADSGSLLLITSWKDRDPNKIYKGMWMYLVKTDGDGNVLWTREYGNGDTNQSWLGEDLRRTVDGGYVITGFIAGGFDVKRDRYVDPTVYMSSDLDYRAFLLKIDAVGNQEWLYEDAGPAQSWTYSVLEVPEGGYVLCGTAGSSELLGPAWIVRLDAAGHEQWSRDIADLGVARAIAPAADGGYVICGTRYLAEVDSGGSVLWTNRTTGTCFDVATVRDGGQVVSGNYGQHATAFKIASRGEPVPTTGVQVVYLAIGVAALIVILAVCGFLLLRRKKQS